MNKVEAKLAEIEILTDVNEHSQAAVAYAYLLEDVLKTKNLSTSVADAYLVILQEIYDRHELSGEIAYHDRMTRDGIVGMIRKELNIHGVI